MSAFVLDCSVAISWFEKNSIEENETRLEAQLRSQGAVVPALWHLEFGNVLAMSERRGQITAEQLVSIVEFVKELPITTETDYDRALDEVLDLARAESLTTYDAAYLELAMRREIPLATLDKKLAKAAAKNGVTVLLDDYSFQH